MGWRVCCVSSLIIPIAPSAHDTVPCSLFTLRVLPRQCRQGWSQSGHQAGTVCPAAHHAAFQDGSGERENMCLRTLCRILRWSATACQPWPLSSARHASHCPGMAAAVLHGGEHATTLLILRCLFHGYESPITTRLPNRDRIPSPLGTNLLNVPIIALDSYR